MGSRRPLLLASAAVIFAGSAYLASPAEAEPLGCGYDDWMAVIDDARGACGTPPDAIAPTVFARCENNNLVVEMIIC